MSTVILVLSTISIAYGATTAPLKTLTAYIGGVPSDLPESPTAEAIERSIEAFEEAGRVRDSFFLDSLGELEKQQADIDKMRLEKEKTESEIKRVNNRIAELEEIQKQDYEWWKQNLEWRRKNIINPDNAYKGLNKTFLEIDKANAHTPGSNQAFSEVFRDIEKDIINKQEDIVNKEKERLFK